MPVNQLESVYHVRVPNHDPASIRWHLADGDEALRVFLAAGRWIDVAAVVKSHDSRTVYRVGPADRALPALFVKHDHPPRWRDRIKALWRCKAGVEFDAGRRLAAAAVPCVPMLAWGRHGSESWLVTRAVRGSQGFWESWHACRRSRPLRHQFIVAWARLIRRMHRAGVVHDDLHRDNILVARKGHRLRFLLVDVYEARTGVHDPPRLLRAIMLTISTLLPELRQRELDHLIEASGIRAWSDDPREAWNRVLNRTCRHTIAYRRAGTSKALRTSRYCRHESTNAGAWLLWLPTSLRLAERALGEHERIARESPEALIRENGGGLASRVKCGRRRLLVHALPRPAGESASSAKARWISAFHAYGPGLCVAAHLAWLSHNNGTDYLIREDLAGVPLSDALAASPAAAPRLLAAAGRMLAHFHAAGITGFPPPIGLIALAKPRNQLHELGLPEATSLRFTAAVTDQVRAAELRALCLCLPPAVPSRGRARLLTSYRRRAGFPLPRMRKLLSLMK
jgi:tRNA A-37 threonylcarbamoyl transferase component Bud32